MAEAMVWTVNKILKWTEQYFAGKGLESPRLDAEILLCDVLKCRRIDLYMRLGQPLVKEELDLYHDYVVRRAGWEPLAYILGSKAFLLWDFKVNSDVLIPRPETELLVEKLVHCLTGKTLVQMEHEAFWRKKAAAEDIPLEATAVKQVAADDSWQRPEEPRILDIGTGSGAIILSLLALLPDATGVAADISEGALAVARENRELLEVEESRVDFRTTDVWSGIRPDEQFHVVVSNPPYIPDDVVRTLAPDVRKEPVGALAGGADGLDIYRRIAAGLPAHLRPDGLAAFEVGIGQGEAVAALCAAQGLTVTAVCDDYAKIDRMVFAARPESPLAEWIKQLNELPKVKEEEPDDGHEILGSEEES